MIKKALSIIITLTFVVSIFVVLPIKTSAMDESIACSGSEYEYANTGVWNPYTNVYQDMDGDGYREIPCTYFAWQKAYEVCGVELPSWSHANTWYSSAQAAGIPTGTEPRVNSIACFNSGSVGHVSFVTAVNNDNTMDVLEGGRYDLDRTASQGVGTSRPSSVVGQGGLQGFIYLDSGSGYVDLGSNFYAFIINTAMWKHLTVEPSINVTIRSEKSGKCADQVFKFERQSDGSYKIISTANGWCLDVNGASSSPGANVSVCGSNDSTAQRWYIYGESGQYRLKAKCTDCVLDIADGSSAEGTNVRMWESNNSDAQKFQIWRWDSRPEAANIGDGFTAPILNTKAWITLENNNDNVILNKEDGQSHQLWRFQRNLDGSYTIFSCLDGKCIDLYDFLHADGTNIGMCGSNNTNAQRWYIYYNGFYFQFQSKESGKFFDIAEGNLESGSNIQAWSWNDSDAQRFSIYGGEECKIMAPTLTASTVPNTSKVVFNRSEVYGETGYILKIWKDQICDGDAFQIIENMDKETTVTLSAGTYQAYVDAYNYYDIKMSNVVTFTIESHSIRGDVDSDGEVSVVDATYIQRYNVNMQIPIKEEVLLLCGDVDGDGEVSVIDATFIQRYDAKIEIPYPVGQPV